MELFKIGSPGASPTPVSLDKDSLDKDSIELGSQCRGRGLDIIPVTGTGPDVRVSKTDAGVVIVRGNWPEETRCLAVINCVGGYDRSRDYDLHDAENVHVVASGSHAFGAAGRTNSGPEVLAIVDAGASFRLNSKYASHWYAWDGLAWMLETPAQRAGRLALAEVAKGGGEWL